MPNQLTYQGRVLESGTLVNGNRDINIGLCNSTANGGCPDNTNCLYSGNQTVSVTNGLFRTTFTVPSGVDLSAPVYIEVREGAAGGGANTCLAPREALTVSPYAILAGTATFLTAGLYAPGINFSGPLGIGTTNPAQKLDVAGNAALSGQLLLGGAVSGGNVIKIRTGINDGLAIQDNPGNGLASLMAVSSAGRLQLGTPTGASQILIDASGAVNSYFNGAANLGIGLTSPAARLHVSSANAAASDTLLQVSSGTSVGQDLVVVKGDGKIGIGIANPGERIALAGSGPAIELGAGVGGKETSAGKIGYERFTTGALDIVGAGTSIGARSVHIHDQLSIGQTFGTAPSNGLAVQGNVGVGLTNPLTLLDINGASTIRGPETVSSTATVMGQDAGGYSLKLSSGINMPTGTVNAGAVLGNGAGLTNINGGQISPGTFLNEYGNVTCSGPGCTATANCTLGRVVIYAVSMNNTANCNSNIQSSVNVFIRHDCIGNTSCAQTSSSSDACVYRICK